jgi:hypothetical protein
MNKHYLYYLTSLSVVVFAFLTSNCTGLNLTIKSYSQLEEKQDHLEVQHYELSNLKSSKILNLIVSLKLIQNFSFLIKEQFIAPQIITTKSTNPFRIQNYVINSHPYNFTQNPKSRICSKSKVFLLVYVHSTPGNFKRRLGIRETWARRSLFPDIRLVFMIGIPNVTTTDYKQSQFNLDEINEMIQMESSLYGDIVQENFIDSYRNLTLKGVMSLKWISRHCSQAKFVLKIDDDIIVNIFHLLRHLHILTENKEINDKSLMCNFYGDRRMAVVRNPKSKWYLSRDDYPFDRFGSYCSGSAYIFTGKLAKQMFRYSFYIKYIFIDDYYVTGLLARAAKASYYKFNSLFSLSTKKVMENFLKEQSEYITFGHMKHDKNIIDSMIILWSNMVKNQLKKNQLNRNVNESIINEHLCGKNDRKNCFSHNNYDSLINFKNIDHFS